MGRQCHKINEITPLFLQLGPQKGFANFPSTPIFLYHFATNTFGRASWPKLHIGGGQFGYNDPHYGSTIGSYNKTVCKSEENARIMYWLSPLEPNTRHQTVRNDRFNGVGDWLLETCEFREWRESRGGADKAVLFCPGNPGVGKTYLR